MNRYWMRMVKYYICDKITGMVVRLKHYYDIKLRNKRGVKGFTLLELSIVLLIIGTLVGGAITIFNYSMRQQQIDITRERLKAIQKALLDYRQAFYSIPCPAPYISNDITASTFGRGETFLATGATCSSVGTYVPSFQVGVTDVYGGGVPVRTLKLPDDYAFDGWGRRFTYFMDSEVANKYAFTNSTISTSPAPGDLLVKDNTGATVAAKVLYVIVSHGENGHGARTRPGAATINAGSTNTNEQDNCGCNSSGVVTGHDANFVIGPHSVNTSVSTDTFDDIVVYGTRALMPASGE